MFRNFIASCALASIAVLLVQCGGKPEIVTQKNHGPGTGGASNADGSAGAGAFIGDTGGSDAGDGCDPVTGLCADAGKNYVPSCGDGRVNPGEKCDDGNNVSGDGCTANCQQVEANFECPRAGTPCTSTIKCGDKKIAGGEKCDDGNTNDHDGCDSTCQLETGWACPIVGIRCEAARCGDGIIAGSEECDDGASPDGGTSGGGCDANCRLKDGYVCPTPGQACLPIVCGDGKAQGNERCDDGNNDLGDGCTPFCQLEPNCDNGACTSPCGDGIKFSNEACDDGNTKDGDGCSSTCQIEPGYTCTLATAAEPDSIGIPIVIRDFSPADADFQIDGANGEKSGDDHAIVGPTLGTASSVFPLGDGATYSMNHKPLYADTACNLSVLPSKANNWTKCTATTFNTESFQEWYRDTPGHPTILQTLTLGRIGNNAYQFDSAANGSDGFFPIDPGDGTQKDCSGHPHNFNFTSEVRYWFSFDTANPPKLEFSGDDDVFVFVNHQLVMDLGGIHGREEGCFVLSDAGGGDYGVQCSYPDAGTNKGPYTHQKIHPVSGLENGKIYEIAVFQAERNTCASNYKLTLTNFLASKSVCKSVCGDGIVTPDEVCDDGPTGNNDQYGKCGPDCKSRGAYCGDGIVQKDHGEQCDDGSNVSPYGGCAPGCVNGPYCGDGVVQGSEECDDGKLLGGYNGCNKDCTIGPHCGDGITQTADGEQCDDGNHKAGDRCAPNCTFPIVQ